MTTCRSSAPEIVALSDRGKHPDEIAAALGLTVSRVYNVLRVERPDRPRKPRERTSDMPWRVRGLLARKIEPRRVAELLDVSRQYVYRIKAEAEQTGG